ncbi:hypothetical protein F4814DRAFT_402302 [Daldinia grandis]|nr:hypothetical protein F4814DRAFT_402302 [Daldinia grandis]
MTFKFPIVCLVLWKLLCRSLCCLWPEWYTAVSLATSHDPRVRPPGQWHGFTAVSVVFSVNLANRSSSRPFPRFLKANCFRQVNIQYVAVHTACW